MPRKDASPLRRASAHVRRVMLLLLDKRGQVCTGMYRTGQNKKGLRGLIGGRAEPRETLATTLRREAREEARVRFRPLGRPLRFTCPVTGAPVYVQVARLKAGRPRPTREMHRFKWQKAEAVLSSPSLSPRSLWAVALLLPRLKKLRPRRRK